MLGKRRVLARRGRVGEKSDFFSILLGILAQDVERLTARRPVAAMYPCSQQKVQTDAGHRTSVDLDKPNSSHLA